LKFRKKFTVIIPARLASTRFPRKPLADIDGKPMIVHTAERASLSGAEQVIVATDHAEILNVCADYGIATQMTRNSHCSGTERIAEVAMMLGLASDDIVVNVQGDEPMIEPSLIGEIAARINDEASIATAAYPSDVEATTGGFNPNVIKVVLNHSGHAMYFSRATVPWYRDGSKLGADLSLTYLPLHHIGIYAYTNKFLQTYPMLTKSPLEKIEALEQLRILWHGYQIAVHVTKRQHITGVDTLEDLERVKNYFSASKKR
jgi:3-deoxy-manno-octulosonate cytidylyltransferase (CMP-KDO synthetase)